MGWPSHITGASYDTFVSLSVVRYLLCAIFCPVSIYLLFAKSAVIQYTQLSLQNSSTLQKLLTHGGLDISLRKRKRNCPLPYKSLLRRNRSFVILQDLVYIISAKFLTHISFILEWHWQWRSCVWEHPWIWQPQQKKKRLTSKGQVISLVVLSWECWLLSGPTLIALLKSTGENDADVWIVAGRRLLPWETYSAIRMF